MPRQNSHVPRAHNFGKMQNIYSTLFQSFNYNFHEIKVFILFCDVKM